MYLDVLGFLNFAVDLLLLLAANRLSGYPTVMRRCLLAAALGGVYGCVCVLPGWSFLSGTLWRVVSLGAMGAIAFGVRADALRRCVLFVLLSMALGGVAAGVGSGSFLSVLLSAAAVCLMCLFGLRGKLGSRFLPVTIRHSGIACRFTAMLDTGNTLTDPITGQQVLVVSSHIARQLLEIPEQELSDAVKTVQRIPGGRLVPFHTVGTKGGILPAKKFQDVTIGSWKGSCLVAFAPHKLGEGEGYDALTGGM